MAQAVKHSAREGVRVLEVAPHGPQDLSDRRCTREDVSTAPKGLQGDESKSLLRRWMDNERRATVHLRKPGFAGPIHLHAGPKVRTSTDMLIQGLEPWDSGVSDEMELVGNPIRNLLERLEGEPRLFDLPVNSHLDDERRLRRVPGDRPEPVFESEGHDVHRDFRVKHRLDDLTGPFAIDDNSLAKMGEPTELLDVQVPNPKTIVLGQQRREEVVDRDDQRAARSEGRIPRCGGVMEHIDVLWIRAFGQRHDLDAQVTKFAGEMVDVLRIPRPHLAVPVEVVRV